MHGTGTETRSGVNLIAALAATIVLDALLSGKMRPTAQFLTQAKPGGTGRWFSCVRQERTTSPRRWRSVSAVAGLRAAGRNDRSCPRGKSRRGRGGAAPRPVCRDRRVDACNDTMTLIGYGSAGCSRCRCSRRFLFVDQPWRSVQLSDRRDHCQQRPSRAGDPARHDAG